MDDSIGKWFSVIYRCGRSYFDTVFSDRDISSGPIQFLPVINESGGLSQDELSEKMYLDKTTVTRGLARLARGGYIKKKQDKIDKRVYRIFLTEKGKKIIPFVIEARNIWVNALSCGFTEEEKKEILDVLKKIAKNALHFREKGFK